MKQAIILLLICLSSADFAFGQTSKGFVVGNVADPNGAVVPNAAVKITNKDTGATRETVSGDDGTYRLDAVDPGTYTMTVIVSGFQTTTRENVVAAVDCSLIGSKRNRRRLKKTLRKLSITNRMHCWRAME